MVNARILLIAGVLFVGCGRSSLERHLIGAWSGCSIDICSTMTFGADHTFSDRFDGEDSDSYSGVWRVEGRQIVIHVLQDRSPDSNIGKDLRWTVFDIRPESFIAGYDEQHQFKSTRVK
jgi:hypothetical protein